MHRQRIVLGWVMAAMLVATMAPAAATEPASHGMGRIERVSFTHDGLELTDHVSAPSLSADGRFVAFATPAGSVVAGQPPGPSRVYVRDRLLGTNELISDPIGALVPNDDADRPVMSGDGRYVLYESEASNLVVGDGNGQLDFFVFDRQTDVTERVTVATDGTEADVPPTIGQKDISHDGSIVAFASKADTLDPGDVDGRDDVFVRDRTLDTTERVSVDWDARHEVGARAFGPALSGNGAVVVYSGSRHGDDGKQLGYETFALDRTAGDTELVSVTHDGSSGAGGSSWAADVSFDGSRVSFGSNLSTLVPGDANGDIDVFVRDRSAGSTSIASLKANGQQIQRDSYAGSISGDGEIVTFGTTGAVFDSPTAVRQIYLRDLATGTTVMVSRAPDGAPADNVVGGGVVSENGRFVGFAGGAENLVDDDDNEHTDAFVFDRTPSCDSGFTDVPLDHPFCWDVQWAASGDLVMGFDDGTFRPATPVTREAVAAVLYRRVGEPTFPDPIAATFSDVPTSHLFFTEVEWLVAAGLADGFDDGTFRPGEPVTRQAVAAFLYRQAGEPPFGPPGTPTFSDVPAGHPFFREVEWMVDVGLADGFDDGTFRPASDVTRQELVAFLHRAA